MDSTRFKHNFFKNRTLENKVAYNQEINFCLSLARITKSDYCNSLDQKQLATDIFWNAIKSFFSDREHEDRESRKMRLQTVMRKYLLLSTSIFQALRLISIFHSKKTHLPILKILKNHLIYRERSTNIIPLFQQLQVSSLETSFLLKLFQKLALKRKFYDE